MTATIAQRPAARRSRPALTMRQRRGRTFRVLGLLLVLLGVLVVAPHTVHMMGRTEPPILVTHTVVPGDTLWDIAAQYNQNEDLRTAIERIKEANAMHTATVQPGQVILVPQVVRR